jgi:hypothetical protein
VGTIATKATTVVKITMATKINSGTMVKKTMGAKVSVVVVVTLDWGRLC